MVEARRRRDQRAAPVELLNGAPNTGEQIEVTGREGARSHPADDWRHRSVEHHLPESAAARGVMAGW
jgi:hypothetical protein